MHLTGGCPLPAGLPEDARDSLAELEHLVSRWDILSDGDIVGYIYQQLQSNNQKKHRGQYFTPGDVVEYLVEKSIPGGEDLSDARILDPACGSGHFLVAAFKRLLHLLTGDGVAPGEAARLIITRHLFGIDRDPIAVRICRYNLTRISGIESEKCNIYNYNYLYSYIVPENPSCTAVPFSLIIGNPPWGSALSAGDKLLFRERFESAKSGLNSFTLFIERSIGLLAEDGRLAFLVPEAYLNIKAHSASRLHLLKHTRILELALWGEKFRGVFAPAASFIARREKRPHERSRNIIQIHNPKSVRRSIVVPGGGNPKSVRRSIVVPDQAGGRSGGTVTLIPQEYYSGTTQHIFNINYTRHAVNLISRIEEQDCIFLKDRAKFFLGIVTGSNPTHLRETPSESHPDPILLGSDISQYRIDFSGHYFRYDPAALQQVAAKDLYLSGNKLLYKFIGKKLIFALDREGLFSLNNVNGLIPQGIDLEPECLTALLNSRVVQYYYETNFFTIKVLRGNLEQLPLKKLSPGCRRRIKSLASELMESGPSDRASTVRENIEDILFHEYGIRDRDAFMISDTGGRDFLSAGEPLEETAQIQ